MRLKLFLFLTVPLMVGCSSGNSEKTGCPDLQFKDGHFKLVQFTDLHLKPYSETTDTTFATIRAILEVEKPDLAVITGDVVCYDPATDGWEQLKGLFEDMNQPFTVGMGNHDAEYLTKDSIYTILMKSPMYVGDKGPSDIHGRGNSAIEIKGKNDAPAAIIYTFDSNDYQQNHKLGYYDWIHFDQIKWYRERAEQYAVKNGGTPVPSLAFFHIPLQEYREIIEDDKTYGNMHEQAGSPAALNPGLYASMAEIGDIMGVFTGHDHNNDFVGMNREIALGFGRSTGSEAYGDLTRGARVIDLYEDARKFDTWIVTPEGREPAWYYPSGINGSDELCMDYLPAVEHNDTIHGVAYTYYEGLCKHTSHITDDMVRSCGSMANFNITDAPADDHFAYRFKTILYVPERGVYRFYTYSDDGSVLSIDGVKVVDNDGGHSVRRREGKVALEAGFHQLDVVYFENYMGQELEVGITGRDIPEMRIPDNMLYLPHDSSN